MSPRHARGCSHLECTSTGERHPADRPHTRSAAGAPLYPRYDLDNIVLEPDMVMGRRADMWRYFEVMPMRRLEDIISLGEGWTPIIPAPRLAEALGVELDLWIKDESQNPAGAMEARELSAAVSRASELGATELTIASPGPRARAAATYAACAGLGCHVFVPEGADPGIVADCETLGARVEVTGDGPARARDGAERHGWVDVSAFAEPYGIEGSKTIAYELYEQLAWTLPDAVVFPDRAGTTREGIAKGLDEMEELGWIDDQRPGMVVAAEEATAELVALAARTTGLIPSRRAAATLATLRTAVDEHTVASGARVVLLFAGGA